MRKKMLVFIVGLLLTASTVFALDDLIMQGNTHVTGDLWVEGNTPGLQKRVTGTCAAGSSIRVISDTGAVTCETDDTGVGANTTNYVPKWNGTALVTGSLFDNGSSIGLGTAAPLAALHVKTASDVLAVLESTDVTAALELTDPSGTVALRTHSGHMIFGVGGFEVAYEKMRINSAGNVGIGTNNPTQKLTVAGTVESTSGGIKFPDGTVQTSAAYSTFSQPCQGNDANDIMVRVGPICVDKYEASVWSTPTGGTRYGASSDNYPCNNNGNDCSGANPIYARSVAGVKPSGYITWFQAQQACAMSGKRLLTNAEWQMAAAGTPDPGFDDHSVYCVIDDTVAQNTGSRSLCVSNWGVNDMVGNVGEWVADWMQGADSSWTPGGYSLPTSWGDDMVSANTIANSYPSASSENLPSAIFRGGSFTFTTSAGVFSFFNYAPSTSVDGEVGFRCGR